jgi:hypothetical protein
VKLIKFGDTYGPQFIANQNGGVNYSDTISIYQDNFNVWFAGATYIIRSTQVLRDSGSWYHLVAGIDTTQATAANRVKLYINGIEVTSLSSSSYPPQNYDTGFNTASVHYIGQLISTYYSNMYLADFYWIDGQALTPSSFGETDTITGRWKAKAYSGTYGTNGFYLKFADNSGTTSTTLGKDSSGNSNNWTPNNLSVIVGAGNDSLVDSPTNYGSDTGLGGEVRGNYPVFNSISKNSSVTISDGGLRAAFTNNRFQSVTIPIPSTGKWYAEFTPLNGSSTYSIGLGDISQNADSAYSLLSASPAISYINNGNKNINGSVTSGGATYTTNDIIGVAVNADLNSVSFYKNNSIQFTVSGSSFSTYSGRWVFGGDASAFSEVLVFNGGQRPFAYTAPTGFKALCTTNLSTPIIQKSSTAMDVVTYTGNGSNGRVISGFNFSPDLVWTKSRSAAYDHALSDTVRSVGFALHSNTTAAEDTSYGLAGVGADNYTINAVNQLNESSITYVAWAWDAGSSFVTNTSGAISSTVRANPQAGFSIVSFVNASGTNQSTVGHGLGVAPKMIIAKNRDTSANNWAVFHSSVCDTTSKFLQLNTTSALTTFATVWGASLPSSSVFGVTGGGIAAASVNIIAYCFAEIEGYSKIGSYTGNGSSDGPFVWCGFRPRWVMIKKTDTSESWIIFDTARKTINDSNRTIIYAESSSSETTDAFPTDIISNGFKVRNAGSGVNSSGGTYIFAAFAESPFKYARAR